MKELTKAEEQVMQILWEIEKGFVKDVIERMPEPKPAYTTIATIFKILEKKGFVDHEEYGKMHRFFPLVQKDVYAREFLQGVAKNYFNSSLRKIASFFVEDNDLSIAELEEIKKIMDREIKSRKETK